MKTLVLTFIFYLIILLIWGYIVAVITTESIYFSDWDKNSKLIYLIGYPTLSLIITLFSYLKKY